MSFEAYILVADGKPLTYTETDNDGESFCVSTTYDLVTWADNVWMVSTAEEASEALEANRRSERKSVPWYNADYSKPSLPKGMVDRVQIAKAEVEFTVKFDPMPILGLNIVGYEILKEGGSRQ